MLPSAPQELTKMLMQNILFAFASLGFHPPGLFTRAEGRREQPWISSRLSSTGDCSVQSCKQRVTLLLSNPSPRGAQPRLIQALLTPSVPVGIPLCLLSLAGMGQPCTPEFLGWHRSWVGGEPVVQWGEGGLFQEGIGMFTACAAPGEHAVFFLAECRFVMAQKHLVVAWNALGKTLHPVYTCHY